MLQRIFLLALLLLSVLAQQAQPDNKDGQSELDESPRETTSLEDQRPRGERADDELPPPRRQRHGCQPDEIFSPFLFLSTQKKI